MSNRSLTVCYFGTYRANYNRNQMMMAGLRLNDVKVIECHETLWKSIEDRVETTTGGWKKPAFWWRVFRTYARLIWKFRKVREFDVLWVGYPGQFDVYLAWVLARIRRKPIVLDILMSIYLVAIERNLDQRSQFTVNMIRFFERISLRLPDLLIQDTLKYVEWFNNNYGIPSAKFKIVPIGVDNREFQFTTNLLERDHVFKVVYYGTFTPNHGIEFMIEAARYLREETQIQFDFIGQGPDKASAQTLAEKYKLRNVNFIDWMEKTELVKHIAHCDVCLGTFSTTTQSLITVHNKVYEGMAMKKVVLTGDSPAVRNQFVHEKHIFLAERKNPESIAKGIITLQKNKPLYQSICNNGYKIIQEQFTLNKTGEVTKKHLAALVTTRAD